MSQRANILMRWCFPASRVASRPCCLWKQLLKTAANLRYWWWSCLLARDAPGYLAVVQRMQDWPLRCIRPLFSAMCTFQTLAWLSPRLSHWRESLNKYRKVSYIVSDHWSLSNNIVNSGSHPGIFSSVIFHLRSFHLSCKGLNLGMSAGKVVLVY